MPRQQPAEQAEPTDQQVLAAQEAVNYAIANTDYRQPPAETPKEGDPS